MSGWVALQRIDHGGVTAYQPGDPVHDDNVQANGYEPGVQVARAGSEQADAALRGLGMLPAVGEPTPVVGPDDPAPPPVGGGFDPAERTVEDVNTHLDNHPDQVDAVLAAERVGKHRAGIMHGRHGTPPDVAES